MNEREARRFPTGQAAESDYTERLRRLEQGLRPLDPDAGERRFLRDRVVDYADGFVEDLDRRPVYVASDGEAGALYDSPISEGPMDPDAVLRLMDLGLNRSGVNVGSPGHMAYIPGSNLYASALADYLGAVINKYSGLYFASPGMVRMERMLLRWVADSWGTRRRRPGTSRAGKHRQPRRDRNRQGGQRPEGEGLRQGRRLPRRADAPRCR